MKMKICFEACLRKFHRGALAAALLGLVGTAGINSQAASVSPVGTWDVQLSGAVQGIAYLTFDENFGLSGYELINPKLPGPANSDRGITDENRTNTVPVGVNTNLLHGFALLSGTWSVDSKGRVVGVYTEGSENRACLTNDEVTTVVSNSIIDYKTNIVTITVTNYFTNQVITCVTNPITNGLSFVANVKPKSITMKSSTTYGNITFHGKPAQETPDISGTYFARGRKTGTPDFNEFLVLTPSPEFFNVYDIIGFGAGYEVGGLGIISSTKKFGLLLNSSATNASLTTGVGTYNYKRSSADISTQDSVSTLGRYKISRQ
jgi:hypothetical protein